MSKRTKDLVKALEKAGYRVQANKSRGQHYTAYNDDNTSRVVISKSPSDCHAVQNACGDLRRAGFKFEFGGTKYNG